MIRKPKVGMIVGFPHPGKEQGWGWVFGTITKIERKIHHGHTGQARRRRVMVTLRTDRGLKEIWLRFCISETAALRELFLASVEQP